MANREVFIVGAARTPIGAFMGSLGTVPATELGSVAIRAALERASLSADHVDETYMGNVLTAGEGQAPARQAAKSAGVPDKVPAVTLNKVCGSGLYSVILGTKSILLEDAEVVVAGGMESMSNAPYLLPKARTGLRMGNSEVVDSMVLDGLWDPVRQLSHGQRRRAVRAGVRLHARGPGRVRRRVVQAGACGAGEGRLRARDRPRDREGPQG